MNSFIYAANLKCNHTRASFAEYAKVLNDGLDDEKVLIFPPFTALDDFAWAKFSIGAQNFYPCQSGAYTGEIGKAHLDEFGITSVLIGHSERRELLHEHGGVLKENDELLLSKFDFAVKNGWQVVYCIGENLWMREAGKTREILKAQLELINLSYDKLIIAYEPIWAIGSGSSASVEQITQVLDFVRTLTAAPLLYGGSVNAKNISDICHITNCNGVLVGTASWDAANFLNLIKTNEG
ncbi:MULTISPECIES: triose-phosphate isomerase [Campylobacter]|uniref:Triosephosphate isomerase n=1 Tax=Campylobacter suis TaxID=2790657 RepID=A0ABM8Q0V9_9BACT|nr:triose-phosphate isomerase [Campylobacter suis]CAD7286420.1 Triosephosphate isomerase [Campylobacter suis]